MGRFEEFIGAGIRTENTHDDHEHVVVSYVWSGDLLRCLGLTTKLQKELDGQIVSRTTEADIDGSEQEA